MKCGRSTTEDNTSLTSPLHWPLSEVLAVNFNQGLVRCRPSWCHVHHPNSAVSLEIRLYIRSPHTLPSIGIRHWREGWCAYVILWMAFYWTAEVIPLAITSLMPVVLFPLLGILSSQRVSSFYLNEIGVILVCAMMLGVAVETSNLHKRIALKSLLVIGTSNRRLLLGLMLVTMFLSMWIPNIAAASIMIPIAMAVVDQMRDRSATKSPIGVRGQQIGSDEKRLIEDRQSTVSIMQEDETPRTEDKRTRLLRTTMVLGVSYATSIGGTGSLLGTGPNFLLKGIVDE